MKRCDSNEIKNTILEEKVLKLFKEIIIKPEALKKHMEVLRSEGKASQMRLQRQLKKLEQSIEKLTASKQRVLELYANGNIERPEYARKCIEYDGEISRATNEKLELVKQIPLLHKPAVIELCIAQYCDEVRLRLGQCKDFEMYRQFFLDFVDHVDYYKNLVEIHGYVPVRSTGPDGESTETRIEYKVSTEIEWAERMAQYWKKQNGTRVSLMDFNQVAGESKKRMRNAKVEFIKSKLLKE